MAKDRRVQRDGASPEPGRGEVDSPTSGRERQPLDPVVSEHFPSVLVLDWLAGLLVLLTVVALTLVPSLLLGLLLIDIHVFIALAGCHFLLLVWQRRWQPRPPALPRAPHGMVYRLARYDPTGTVVSIAAEEGGLSGVPPFSVVIVAIDDLRDGQTIILEAGQAVPTDGTIIAGSAALDERAVTGEVLPVVRGAHGPSEVIRDTRVLSGRLLVQVVTHRGHPLDWIT